MIDEARVPLVIAGRVEREDSRAHAAGRVSSPRWCRASHFDTDEYGRDVELTERGIERVEQSLGCGSLH